MEDIINSANPRDKQINSLISQMGWLQWKISKEDKVNYKDQFRRALQFLFCLERTANRPDLNSPMNKYVSVYQKIGTSDNAGDYVIVSIAANNPGDIRIFEITNETISDDVTEDEIHSLIKKVMEMADGSGMYRNNSQYGDYGKILETADLEQDVMTSGSLHKQFLYNVDQGKLQNEISNVTTASIIKKQSYTNPKTAKIISDIRDQVHLNLQGKYKEQKAMYDTMNKRGPKVPSKLSPGVQTSYNKFTISPDLFLGKNQEKNSNNPQIIATEEKLKNDPQQAQKPNPESQVPKGSENPNKDLNSYKPKGLGILGFVGEFLKKTAETGAAALIAGAPGRQISLGALGVRGYYSAQSKNFGKKSQQYAEHQRMMNEQEKKQKENQKTTKTGKITVATDEISKELDPKTKTTFTKIKTMEKPIAEKHPQVAKNASGRYNPQGFSTPRRTNPNQINILRGR